MTQECERFSARRRFLRHGAGAALGAAALFHGGGAQAARVSKAAMAYRESAGSLQVCAGCIYFQPAVGAAAGSCAIVAGSISPHGHCIAFSPRL